MPIAKELVITNFALTGIYYNLGAFIGAFILVTRLPRQWNMLTLWLISSDVDELSIRLCSSSGSFWLVQVGVIIYTRTEASFPRLDSHPKERPSCSHGLSRVCAKCGYYLTILSAYWAIGAVIDAVSLENCFWPFRTLDWTHAARRMGLRWQFLLTSQSSTSGWRR